MQRTIVYVIVCLVVLLQVHPFEIVLNQTNQSYRIRLFEKQLISLRLSMNDYPRNLIGFKCQFQSSNPRVLDVRNEIPIGTTVSNNYRRNKILLDDFFVCRLYTNELDLRIPFLSLVASLGLVVIPYSIGIGISHCSSKIRSMVEKLVKPIMLCLLMFFLIFGTIVYWYITDIMDIYTASTAALLPYLGYLFGAFFSWIFGLDWSHVKTIGIEAGIQNTNIALMIIFYSFPELYASKAIVIPLIVGFLTTKPFWLIYILRSRLMNRKRKSHHSQHSNGKLTSVEVKSTEEKIVMTEEIIEMK